MFSEQYGEYAYWFWGVKGSKQTLKCGKTNKASIVQSSHFVAPHSIAFFLCSAAQYHDILCMFDTLILQHGIKGE